MLNLRFWEALFNPPLMAAFLAMGSSQLFKYLRSLARGQRPHIKRIVEYGGFPSSHTAFITACVIAIGLTEGFRSSTFALGVVAACIFAYDILRLRMTIAQSKVELDRLIEGAGLTRLEKAPQVAAHSLPEVLAGVVWGFAAALIVCLPAFG
ncbi:MAG: divergent PAP2 family protein [Spirochaetota bacterium]